VIGHFLRWLVSPSERRRRQKLREWEAQGRSGPPPSSVKHEIIRDYGRRFALGTFVETGTFRGGTVVAVRAGFRRIVTVELDEILWAQARRRLARFPHVTVLHGDSAELLPALLPEIAEPTLFWLDAHYSEGVTARSSQDTPIRQELAAILGHRVKGHVILIDDAREFGADPAYPTLVELEAYARTHDAALVFEVRDDVIRIHRAV
jgi:hypothetical protein